MFSIPSIGIHVLLVIALGITEFPSPGNSSSADETCVNVSGEIICYFKGSEKLLDWNNASQLCGSFKATLPVIRNINDQDAVAGYLRSHTDTSVAWTAGKNFTYSNWTWVNKEPLKEPLHVQLPGKGEQFGENIYAALDTDFRFIASAIYTKMPYICQYEGAYCSSSSDINMTDKCLRVINDNRTWYDARNQCLMTGGDLSVIGDDVHGHLKEQLTLKHSHWIGLRKKSWRWIRNDNAKFVDEIKYTNWDNYGISRDGECISIGTSDGKWKTVGCNDLKTVVCQRGQAVTSVLTTETSDENIQTKVESFTSSSKETTGNGSQGSMPQSLVFGLVGAGIVIIICIIVFIIFALRTKKKSVKEISQSKPSNSSSQNNREELDSWITNAPVYASIIEPGNPPVQRSDDIRDDYEEIPFSSTLDQSEDGATSQEPGIVYSSLEFNENSTYMQPDKKWAHAAAPAKVDPLGDIYAMPDVEGHAVTSPVTDSASPPVEVTPQGDIYTLLVETSKSPTANTPGEAVYTRLNLQTEILDKQQPGIVYDALEFNEDPTYLPTDKKRLHASAPTKVGPLGDIYAMSDVRAHAVTSPGNDSASPPANVTPQGDIYVPLLKTSKSPTEDTPCEGVYNSFQTEILDKQQATEEHDQSEVHY